MKKLPVNITILDDLPHEVKNIIDKLSDEQIWDSYELVFPDSRMKVVPEFHSIVPNDEMDGEKFLKYLQGRLFGKGYHCAALSPLYQPCSVFLIDWRFDDLVFNPNRREKIDGPWVCKQIKKYIPNAFCCLITIHNTLNLRSEDYDFIDFSIEKSEFDQPERVNKLIRSICQHLKDIGQTPSWKGLVDYSKLGKEVMHALAVADGKNISHTTQEFINRFGQNLFFSEASLTMKPLDSLLSPKGCIKDSQDLFAKNFGARNARFTTNGTTGSNNILWTALFNQGDVVLVDKHCHISHHYAAAKQGVTPYYLEAETAISPDIFAAPTISTVLTAVDNLIEHGLIERLKGIVITNCTFDGYVISPFKYIQAIDKHLSSLGFDSFSERFIYLFDEAWFSFARFDPGLIKFSAMYAAKHVKTRSGFRPRIYATQSVHKSLTAMRQASVILEYDEYKRNGNLNLGLKNPRFEQSFLSNTTTSPSAPIVASIDVGARQMMLEGQSLIKASTDASMEFRKLIKGQNWADIGEVFRFQPQEVKRVNKSCKAKKIPTMVTVFHNLNKGGSSAKSMLWEKTQVQVNKFGVDSFMFMFMPGYNSKNIPNLLGRLKKISSKEFTNFDRLEYIDETSSYPIKCLDQNGRPAEYPIEIIRNGFWNIRECLYGVQNENFLPTGISELDSTKEYIIGSFVTPYPPGFPILYPGQIVLGETIKSLIDSSREIHGLIDGIKLLVCEL